MASKKLVKLNSEDGMFTSSPISRYEYKFLSVDKECSPALRSWYHRYRVNKSLLYIYALYLCLAQIAGHYVFHAVSIQPERHWRSWVKLIA